MSFFKNWPFFSTENDKSRSFLLHEISLFGKRNKKKKKIKKKTLQLVRLRIID